MRFVGLLVALVLILLAAILTNDSCALLSPIARGLSGPAEIVTVAQATTVAGWQIALSLNSIHINSASACEYTTLRPGTTRMAADITITPVGPPSLIASTRIFSRVETGDYRYALRLPDYEPDGSTIPGSLLAGRSKDGSTLADTTETPGMKYSLGLIASGLWGRIVYDRIDNSHPTPA